MSRSENWRINKSSVMAVEGAQILRALQKVAGAAGLPKQFRVTFAAKGQQSSIDLHARELRIGGGKIFQEAPLDSELFDVLVGLVLHEVGHWQIMTELALDELTLARMDPKEQALFRSFMNVGEDIVIDSHLARNKNLEDYVKATLGFFQHKVAESGKRADTSKLLELWIEYALYHNASALMELPDEMVTPMKDLAVLTGWLRSVPTYRDRSVAYHRYWATVRDTVMNPPKPKSKEQEKNGQERKSEQNDSSKESTCSAGQSKSGDEEVEKPGGGPAKAENGQESKKSEKDGQKLEDGAGEQAPESEIDNTSTSGKAEVDTPLNVPLGTENMEGLDETLLEEINEALESDTQDITQDITEELEKAGVTNAEAKIVLRLRETGTAVLRPNMELCKRLERITTIKKRLQSRTCHGEKYGRIDKRHLHRVATDQKIFSLKWKYPDGFPKTKILLDLSGSMTTKQTEDVLQAAAAMHSLVGAEVWCYQSGKQVELIRVDDGKLVHQFGSAGNTPSGLAIMGVSLGMKRNDLIVHLTDGGHNDGIRPRDTGKSLAERGINLVNIIWGQTLRLDSYSGLNVQSISGLAEFPDALYEILVEKSQIKMVR